MSENKKTLADEMCCEMLMGLTTDGAHHKQWCLDAALKILLDDESYKKAKEEFQWSEGIAP